MDVTQWTTKQNAGGSSVYQLSYGIELSLGASVVTLVIKTLILFSL